MVLQTYSSDNCEGLVVTMGNGVPVPLITFLPTGTTYWVEFRWPQDYSVGPIYLHDMTRGDGFSYLWAQPLDATHEDAHPLDFVFPYDTETDAAVVQFLVAIGWLDMQAPPQAAAATVVCRYVGPQPEDEDETF